MHTTAPKTVVIIAGEASGDLHGAHVIQALRKRHPDIYICGAGGNAMRSVGAKILIDVHQLSVMGFTAILTKAPAILKAASRLKKLLASVKPDLLVLIDFPDFNLHMAGYAKKIGIPVLYYISPQVWAWRSNRIKKIKRRVDHMAVILPFEKPIYEKHGIPVSFVGHPLMDAAPPQYGVTKNIAAGQTDMTVCLLPGSRDGEVSRLLPAMLRAARLLKNRCPGIQFLLSCAPTIDRKVLQQIMNASPLPDITLSTDPLTALFEQSHLSIVASGTASLEAAIYGIPAIIVYSTSMLNYAMAKLLIEVPYIGLANLIAQRRVMPELIQENASAEKIAEAAYGLLSNPDAYKQMQMDLIDVRNLLGGGGASDHVAEIACRLMGNR
jgi:lipid-A-disaccharide synthase